LKRIVLTLAAMAAGCSGPSNASNGPADASSPAPEASTPDASSGADATTDAEADAGVWQYAAECAEAGSPPPNTIECTGLYADVASNTLAPGIRAYAPAIPLWADFAEKERWIYLPPGTTIDATDPNEWIFPVGTKLFKQFTRDGKRVETRMWQKTQPNFWVRATYAWNADDTEATISAGADLPWGTDGGVYHIPTGDECDQCHRGRDDRILGFEQVSLGLAGATGLTLAELASEKLIAPIPTMTSLTVGDDGTGKAPAPLSWLHINCGVTCHNDNSNSTAYGSSMRLRLDPTMLDGGSSVDVPSRTTTMDVLANSPGGGGQARIIPGDPTHSLLVELISNRGTDDPAQNQMPPIATNLVDVPDTQNVIAWIAAMSPLPTDAGADGN
jgi:hypothetical protein